VLEEGCPNHGPPALHLHPHGLAARIIAGDVASTRLDTQRRHVLAVLAGIFGWTRKPAVVSNGGLLRGGRTLAANKQQDDQQTTHHGGNS